MEEEKKQHLEFIQNVITRMNSNSFQIKGAVITIVSALFAIYASSPKVLFIFIAVLPIIIFWCLDSFYLQQERKFRGVYDDVTGLKSLNEVKTYEMPINKYKGGDFTYYSSFKSKTIIWLYLPLLLLVLGIGTYIVFNTNAC